MWAPPKAASGNDDKRAIEAERIWWSEASERHVKELESTFGAEFQKTCERLRSDITGCQDRLEFLVEAEKKQRHSAFADVKRELDMQQVTLAEVRQGQLELRGLKEALETRLQAALEDVGAQCRGAVAAAAAAVSTRGPNPGEFAELRADLDATQSQRTAHDALVMARLEHHGAQISALDFGLADLKASLASAQASQDTQRAYSDAAMQELRADVRRLREEARGAQTRAASGEATSETVRSLMAQQSEDLNRSIRDASGAMASAERHLCEELEALRRRVRDAEADHAAALAEAKERSGVLVAERMGEERRLREAQAIDVQARLDRMQAQFEDLTATTSVTRASLPQDLLRATASSEQVEELRAAVAEVRGEMSKLEASTVAKLETLPRQHSATAPEPSPAAAEELLELVSAFEALRAEVGRLEAAAADDRRRADEVARIAREAVDMSAAVSRSTQRVEQDMAHAMASNDTRAAFSQEFQELRRSTEETMRAVQEIASEAIRISVSASVGSPSGRRGGDGGLSTEQTEMLSEAVAEVASLRAALRILDAECRQSGALQLAPRVEALEVEVARHSEATARLEEYFREGLEREADRSQRGASALAERATAAEEQVQRLAAECRPLRDSVELILDELHTLRSLTTSGARSVSLVPLTVVGRRDGQAVARSQSCSGSCGSGGAELEATPLGSGGVLQGSLARTPPEAIQMSLLSEGLKLSIRNIGQKVSQTLNAKSVAIASPLEVSNGMAPSAVEARADPGLLQGAEGELMVAIQAVQELMRNNLSLREANAELAEELMHEGEGAAKDVGSLPRWTPSQQNSACNTPATGMVHGGSFIAAAPAPALVAPAIAYATMPRGVQSPLTATRHAGMPMPAAMVRPRADGSAAFPSSAPVVPAIVVHNAHGTSSPVVRRL